MYSKANRRKRAGSDDCGRCILRLRLGLEIEGVKTSEVLVEVGVSVGVVLEVLIRGEVGVGGVISTPVPGAAHVLGRLVVADAASESAVLESPARPSSRWTLGIHLDIAILVSLMRKPSSQYTFR